MYFSLLLALLGALAACGDALQLNATHYPLLRQIYPGMAKASEEDFVAFSKLLMKAYFHAELKEKNQPKTPAVTAGVFPCSVSSGSFGTPATVNEIRPRQVEVIASMGDSLVAAFGARSSSIFTVFTEWRGVSFIGGGLDDISKFVTVPNIIKFFNPNLEGYAIGKGNQDSANAKLNVAVTGAKSPDMLGQAKTLVTKLAAMNALNKVKVISIQVGPNNLCVQCDDEAKWSGANFAHDYKLALDYLQANTNMTFVNVLGVIDVTELYSLSTGWCSLLHAYECPCGVQSDAAKRAKVSAAAHDYNTELAKVVKNYNTDNFVAMFQPWPIRTGVPPTNGPDYFAPDCFHLSELGQTAASVATWNNIVEGVVQKKDKWVVGEPIECPSPGSLPYLKTYKN